MQNLKSGGLIKMNERERIYSDIFERIRCSKKDWMKINSTKQELESLLNGAFQDDPAYFGMRFIGSTETGHSVKWIRDIDAVLALKPYDSNIFRNRIYSLSSEIEDLAIRSARSAVRDIASGNYRGEHISIIGIEGGHSPLESLEADVWLHPDYAKEHLSESQKRDVVLAKIFFRVLGVPKKHVGCGFTLEQLIVEFGSFDQMLGAFAKGDPIYIDNSGRYTGEVGPLTVTYPYSGLANLSSQFTEKDLEKTGKYAKVVLDDPLRFLEDAISGYNIFMWDQRANQFGSEAQYSSPDIYLTQRENRTMNRLLRDLGAKRVTDLGCANGFSTLEMTKGLNLEVIGVDSAFGAIKHARQLAENAGRRDVTYIHGDMIAPEINSDSQDVAIMKRSLGNIPSRRLQQKALEEAHRIIIPGGALLVYDSFQEGYSKLSALRERFGVTALRQPNHTYLLSEASLRELSSHLFDVEDVRDDTSTYHLITRVAYPAVMSALRRDLEKLRFASSLHRLSARLPSIGKFGASKLYKLRKK